MDQNGNRKAMDRRRFLCGTAKSAVAFAVFASELVHADGVVGNPDADANPALMRRSGEICTGLMR